jgi:hypothetical protein
MRSNYRIPVFKPAEHGIEPWLNLGNAAQILKIAPKTLRLAAEAGEIESIHPLSDGPWIFARATLTMFAAQSITERARLNRKYPAGSHPNQQNQALITILRLIDGLNEVNDEKILQTLLRSIKTLAEKGLGRKPT